MKTYKCVKCGTVFEHPETWEEDRGEFWGIPCSETVSGCPNCRGDYEKAFQCIKCGDWFFEDELKNEYCELCYDDLFNGGKQ